MHLLGLYKAMTIVARIIIFILKSNFNRDNENENKFYGKITKMAIIDINMLKRGNRENILLGPITYNLQMDMIVVLFG